MPNGQPTKTGIIYMAVDTDTAKTMVGSLERPIEKGFITFVGLGVSPELAQPMLVWAQLKLFRREVGSAIIFSNIAAGYVDTMSAVNFTGRLPVFNGDVLILQAMSTLVETVTATIRFERD